MTYTRYITVGDGYIGQIRVVSRSGKEWNWGKLGYAKTLFFNEEGDIHDPHISAPMPCIGITCKNTKVHGPDSCCDSCNEKFYFSWKVTTGDVPPGYTILKKAKNGCWIEDSQFCLPCWKNFIKSLHKGKKV